MWMKRGRKHPGASPKLPGRVSEGRVHLEHSSAQEQGSHAVLPTNPAHPTPSSPQPPPPGGVFPRLMWGGH